MNINLNKLPKTFTKDDKEVLEYMISLNSGETTPLTEWLTIITRDDSLSKLQKITDQLKDNFKLEISKSETFEEVNIIKTQLAKQIFSYKSLGMEAPAKVFEAVTMSMIITLADFNIANEKQCEKFTH
jgi:hypothetical protein